MDVQKLMDIYEVQQVASAYVHHLNGRQRKKLVDVFTQHTPGQKIQITDWGVWEGEDAAKRLFLGFMDPPDTPEKPITMGRHELTSPYIVIADDGESAIGVWNAPGWETAHYFDHWVDGESFNSESLAAWWNWGAYWMAFRKEDGVWKLWQLKFLIAINCDMRESYAQANSSPRLRVNWDSRPKELWPDREGTEWVYHADGEPMPLDRMPLPEPYATWTDDLSII